jgi:hypothetical protein
MLISHEAIAKRAHEIRGTRGFAQVRREECWAMARWELIAEACSTAGTSFHKAELWMSPLPKDDNAYGPQNMS